MCECVGGCLVLVGMGGDDGVVVDVDGGGSGGQCVLATE